MHVCVYTHTYTHRHMCVCLSGYTQTEIKEEDLLVYFSIDRIYYNRDRFLYKKFIHIIKKIENTYSSFPIILNKQKSYKYCMKHYNFRSIFDF